jgi:mycofactocin system creatininase family protein
MRLDQLTWTEVAGRASSSLLAVPVGSTEQHGPHLPLSTDTDVAVALCDRLASARPDVLVAPAVAYGSAGEHAGFAGTLSLGAGVTEELLVELGRSADAFAALVFVSPHGGNAGPVAAATRRLTGESRRVRAWSPGPTTTSSATRAPGRTGDAHAGFTETSVMLHLAPGAVRRSQAAAGATAPLRELMGALRASGVGAVSPNGVLGDPTGASAASGAALVDRWSADLRTYLAGWP